MNLLILATSLMLSTAPLPKDTLRVDSTTLIGVAVPTRVLYTHGDVNFDGVVSTSDVMSLAYHVLLGRALPAVSDTVAQQVMKVTRRSATVSDTVFYTFIPTRGVKR